jgi:hypothetical protein
MPDAGALEREFNIFARYLGAGDRGKALAPQYVIMHASLDRGLTGPADGWLVAIARWGTFATALADAYARIASPYGVLRRKLVLTLALLESAGASHTSYDSARPASLPWTLISLVLLGVRWGLVTLIAVAVLAPLHLAAGAGRLAIGRVSRATSHG